MNTQTQLKLIIYYRTEDTQGPNYADLIAHDRLHLNAPILASEIEQKLSDKYGPFITRYVIGDEQPAHAQPAPPAEKSQSDGDALDAEESAFVEAVRQNPGIKYPYSGDYIRDGKEAVWEKPERLGIVHAVGSYKWKITTPKPADALAADGAVFNDEQIVSSVRLLSPDESGNYHLSFDEACALIDEQLRARKEQQTSARLKDAEAKLADVIKQRNDALNDAFVSSTDLSLAAQQAVAKERANCLEIVPYLDRLAETIGDHCSLDAAKALRQLHARLTQPSNLSGEAKSHGN